MAAASLEIVPCPAERTREAIDVALCEIAPEQRREIARDALPGDDSPSQPIEGLYIALEKAELCGAAWGQRQPGNTAVFWPPKWNRLPQEGDASERLATATIAALDTAGIAMTQVMLPSGDADIVPVLATTGFRHLADLVYLTSEAASFPKQPPRPTALQLEDYQPSARERMARLIERTYEGTRDCADLNGARRTEDVLEGYEATGSSGTAQWYFARAEGRDVGVLLLAEYPEPRHWELVYMGLAAPERGRGWGLQLVHNAQWLAHLARVERIVLAVDAANLPAIAIYREAGFVAWDRRAVFVRFAAKRQA